MFFLFNHRTLDKCSHLELVSGSIGRVTQLERRETQPHGQIDPFRIFGVDKINLPRSMPIFQLLLALDRALHVAKHLKMHKAVNGIFRRMLREQAVAMLRKAQHQIGRHADIERAVKLARKDIGARLFFLSHVKSLAEKWMLERQSPKVKQVQHDELLENTNHPQNRHQNHRHPELVSGSIERFTQSLLVSLKGTAK